MRRIRAGLSGLLTASALSLLLPLGGGGGTVARAAPDDIVAIVIEGTGFGHGRGMSQWGAYGYAVDHGWGWAEILDHYYGGTDAGAVVAGQRIRVRLTAMDGQGTVGIVSAGSPVQWNGFSSTSMYAEETSPGVFDIYGSGAASCPGESTLTVPDGPVSIAPTTYNAAARDVQQFLAVYHTTSIIVDGYFGPQTQQALIAWQQAQNLTGDGVWDADDVARAREIILADGGSQFTLLGTETTSAGDPVTFTTANAEDTSAGPGQVLGVCRSDRSVTHYRGSIDVLSTSSGNRVVNDVDVEAYVRGVVPKEIAAEWANAGSGAGANAVRAQAVAARSYGLQQTRSYFYDGTEQRYATTCDTTSCQVYGGAARRASATGAVTPVEHSLSDAAIVATAGVVRRWPVGHASAGQIVSTEFSASNGPRTAGGAFPPVDDIGDDTVKNPNHHWTRVIDADTLESSFGLGQLTSATMVEAASGVYQVYDGIWFNDIELIGTNGAYRKQAWDFRGAFDLPSPGFTVSVVRQSTSGKSIGLIGDSVGNSIAHAGASEFRSLTDGTFASATIDVYDGRCTTKASCPGSTGVDAATALPFGIDLVVVELGYNDAKETFAADIEAMMTALTARGVGRVAWVNMADIRTNASGSAYGPMNAALTAAASRWSNLSVLDWNASSAHPEARARWFTDGVHLSSTGQAQFALWLRTELLGLAPTHWLAPPKRIELPIVGESVTGVDGAPLVVPPDAVAVALNITAFLPVDPGYVTVWPCTAAQPLTSNLNYDRNDVIANNVIAPIADDGTVCLFSYVGTDLIVDVAGWFTSQLPAAESAMVAVTPTRVVDTRDGFGWPGRVTPSNPMVIDIRGLEASTPDGVTVVAPADVSAVSLNVTAVGPSRDGFLTVWPCSQDRPLAASVNYGPFDVVGNGVLSAVGPDGRVCVYSEASTDVVVDVQGWFRTAGGVFTAATPQRLVDTRYGVGAPEARVVAATPLTVQVQGRTLDVAGVPTAVPSTATAAVVNVVSFLPDDHGYVTVWPCDGDPPLAANLVYAPGDVIANGVVAPISPDGTICLFTLRAAHLILDISGWLDDGAGGGFTGVVPKRFVDTREAMGPAPS